METDRKWVIVRIDGKIAAISTDYRMLASISASLARRCAGGAGSRKKGREQKAGVEENCLFGEIKVTTAGFDEVWKLRKSAGWDDLMLFGTDFQKRVWRKLWELTHPSDQAVSEDTDGRTATGLISYSDFAGLCQNRAGVRAVAHAIGLNPVAVVIPCHLVVPKESVDRIMEIHKKAEATIFKGDDLCLSSILSDSSIDYGEYSLGRRLKRKLILMELG